MQAVAHHCLTWLPVAEIEVTASHEAIILLRHDGQGVEIVRGVSTELSMTNSTILCVSSRVGGRSPLYRATLGSESTELRATASSSVNSRRMSRLVRSNTIRFHLRSATCAEHARQAIVEAIRTRVFVIRRWHLPFAERTGMVPGSPPLGAGCYWIQPPRRSGDVGASLPPSGSVETPTAQ